MIQNNVFKLPWGEDINNDEPDTEPCRSGNSWGDLIGESKFCDASATLFDTFWESPMSKLQHEWNNSSKWCKDI